MGRRVGQLQAQLSNGKSVTIGPVLSFRYYHDSNKTNNMTLKTAAQIRRAIYQQEPIATGCSGVLRVTISRFWIMR